MKQFIVVFSQRAREGATTVGPFSSREIAQAWAAVDTAGGTASWEVWPLEQPYPTLCHPACGPDGHITGCLTVVPCRCAAVHVGRCST